MSEERQPETLPAISPEKLASLFKSLAGGVEPQGKDVALPILTKKQAFFLSWVLDGLSPERVTEKYIEEFEELPEVAEWMEESDFRAAVELGRDDRKQLIKAMSLALIGSSFRAISWLLDQPSVSAKDKGLQILFRLHGMLIDRKDRGDVGKMAELLQRLRARAPVLEGQFKVLGDGKGRDENE